MKKQITKRHELVPVSDALEELEDLFKTKAPSADQGVWAEPQLYLLPLCVPQDRTAERFRQIEITETVTIDGQIRHRSFIVNPHPKLGLPGSFELEVMTGIYKIADRHLKESGAVPEFLEIGSFRSFLESIGRTGCGKYVEMLKEGLRRLAGTNCISEGFFYSKPRNLYVMENFSFITSLQIAGETDFSGNSYERTHIRLHEFIRENLNSNFRTLIDFDALRLLRTEIAKPLSLHIAYRIFKNKSSEWIADYDWLAERLGVKKYPELWRAKEQLKPALTELVSARFIERWEWSGRKLKLVAGQRLIEMHQRRVIAKDAWLAHQQEKIRAEQLVIAFPPRTAKEKERQDSFDPLAPICADFAYRGWKAVASKALARGLTEESLAAETSKRGFSINERRS